MDYSEFDEFSSHTPTSGVFLGMCTIFGTAEIEGVGSYYLFYSQMRTQKTLVLTERTVFDTFNLEDKKKTPKDIVAVLRIWNNGKMLGYGKTYLLTRLLEAISVMTGRAASNKQSSAYGVSCSYRDESSSDFVEFKADETGRSYTELQLVYEGFRISLTVYRNSIPYSLPNLIPVVDEKSEVAVVAGLGVRTFALLRKKFGDKLDWYDHKDYKLISTDEAYVEMMTDYLDSVQNAASKGTAVLTALDTETTGLNMYDLKVDNPNRDRVVAIPFGWRSDKAYVICTDMHYFTNVDGNLIYPIFHTLFSRNKDYTSQHIELDFADKHYSFERKNIMLVGANVDFDIRAFLSEGCDLYFDEDIQKLHYLLATDWVQGKNSLKWMTHHYVGDWTLELEDLFGPQHRDKYRYISDPELALVYGGADADYPRVLWKKLRRIISDNLYALYKKYDMTAVYQTAKATWRGMEIDEQSVKNQGDLILADMETLKSFIYKYAYAANRDTLAWKASAIGSMIGAPDSEVRNIGVEEQEYRYKFTPANHKKLLFNILKYPVVKISEKSKEPALDKAVLEKLASKKRETPVEFLTQDIMSVANPEEALISKDEFNRDQYPLARVFLKYSELNKEYSAYYKPIMTSDLEGRMFYQFTLQRAATRRILSPGQTMKGTLKKLCIAPPGQLYLCFDASQIEYRHMASMAYIQTKSLMQQQYPDDWEQRLYDSGIARIHRMMQSKEADYHIETASMMTGQPQYKIDPYTRKMYKKIGFGIPYGLGNRRMCENLFGEVNKENLAKTKEVISDYKARQFEIIRYLESTRDKAFIPAKIPDEFRKMLGIGDTHVGQVHDFVGFYRMFILEGLTRERTGRIRRQAGNFDIQGGAAELFRRMIYNFYMGCVKAGISDGVHWKMLVHDEIDSTFSDKLDTLQLIKIVHQNCSLFYPDHIPYYIGIGIGHNWEEAKCDDAELPVIMVDRMVKAYDEGRFSLPSDGQQPENLLRLKRHYLCDRVGEILSEIVPNIGPGFKWEGKVVDVVAEKFTNYVVRAYLSVFVSDSDRKRYGKNVPLEVQLTNWQRVRESYGFGRDFLTEKFVDAQDAVRKMVFDDDVSLDDSDLLSYSDMSIDLLENEMEIDEINGDGALWFNESSLFDYSVPSDEVVSDEGSEGYRYMSDRDSDYDDEDIFTENENPTNAFDLYVANRYVRKHVMTTSDTVYTVMLTGTKFNKNPRSVVQVIKKEFQPGNNTVIVIGDSIHKVVGVDCKAELLDKLDKALDS